MHSNRLNEQKSFKDFKGKLFFGFDQVRAFDQPSRGHCAWGEIQLGMTVVPDVGSMLHASRLLSVTLIASV